jgi:hypothetical protein
VLLSLLQQLAPLGHVLQAALQALLQVASRALPHLLLQAERVGGPLLQLGPRPLEIWTNHDSKKHKTHTTRTFGMLLVQVKYRLLPVLQLVLERNYQQFHYRTEKATVALKTYDGFSYEKNNSTSVK